MIFGITLSFKWEYIAVTILAVIWCYREYLWYKNAGILSSELEGIKIDKETLLFRLNIEQLSFVCSDNTTVSENANTLLTLVNHSLNLQPDSALYNWFGLGMIGAFCLVICLENYYLHEVNRPEDENGEAVYKQILLKVNEFVVKRHPITTLSFFIILSLFIPWAWFGLFDRTTFVHNVLKLVLSFSSASLLFFITHNGRRLLRYFPRDMDEWRLALIDPSWWLWVVSRLLGVYDLTSGTATVLWMGSLLWFSWPFRYFFYYSNSVCGSGGIGSVIGGAANQVQLLAQREAVNVFLINMVGHSSLLVAATFLLYLLVIVPPLPSARTDGGQLPQDNFVMRWWSALHRKSDGSVFVAVLSILSLCNSLLALLRVIWFVCLTSPCGFYASCVAWMFVHAHIGLSVWTLPVVNALMQRSSVIETYRAQFVKHFCEETTKASSDGDRQPVDAVEAELTGSEVFDNVLILTTLFFVFVQPYVKTSEDSEPKSKTEGGEEADVKLVDVFQAMLRTEMLAHAAAASASHEEKNAEQKDDHILFGQQTDVGDDEKPNEETDMDSDLS